MESPPVEDWGQQTVSYNVGLVLRYGQTAISVQTNKHRESKHILWKTSRVPLSTEWNSLLLTLFLHLAVQLRAPNKTKANPHKQTAPLPVSTPLTLQLCLQKDPLQLPLQGGGDAVLRPCQTLPAAHGCDQLLQLDPGAWWGNNTSSRVCNDAQAVRQWWGLVHICWTVMSQKGVVLRKVNKSIALKLSVYIESHFAKRKSVTGN